MTIETMDLTRVDVRRAVVDFPRKDLPVKIRCREPGHRDTEESMVVYSDGVKCYGCGKAQGRRMEALAYLLYGDARRWRDAIAVAAAYTFQSEEQDRRRDGRPDARRDPLPSCVAELYHDYLLHGGREHRLCWFATRGLLYETVRSFKLGHDGTRFTIPVFDTEGRLISVRFRRDDFYGTQDEQGRTYSKYSGLAGRNGDYLYPENRIAEVRPETLYLFEGELDCILAWQLGLPAVAITNGAGNLCKIPAMLAATFPFVKHLVVVGDMDEAGAAAAAATQSAGHDAGYAVVGAVRWPLADGKDMTEWVQRGCGHLSDLVEKERGTAWTQR